MLIKIYYLQKLYLLPLTMKGSDNYGKKLRASVHNGKHSQKTGRVINPKHNDFERGKNPNVYEKLIKENVYFNCFDGEYTEGSKAGNLTFEETELQFYNERYGASLQMQNDHYIKARHKEGVKSMSDWLHSSRYAPTETILRFGNVDDGYPDNDSLLAMGKEYVDYLNKWSKEHNDCLHVLDWALHADEVYNDDDTGELKHSTPHFHIRWVLDYEDENGNRAIGKEQALEKAGYALPKTTSKTGRYNHRNMTFTSECRQVFQQIGIAHGYDIETEPLPQKRKSVDIESYVAQKRAEKQEKKALDAQKQYQLLIEQEQLKQQRLNATLSAIEHEQQAVNQKEKVLDSKIKETQSLKSQLADEKAKICLLRESIQCELTQFESLTNQAAELIDEIKDAKRKQELMTKYKNLSNRYNYAVNYMGAKSSPPTDEYSKSL